MPDRPIVAFLLPNLQAGGAERVFVTLLRELDRTRFRPTLILGRREGAFLADVPGDVPVRELGALRARGAVPPLLRAVWQDRPELLFGTVGMANAAALARPLLPRSTKLVARLGNTLSAFYADVHRESPRAATVYRWLNRALYAASDAVVCQSDVMLDDAALQIGLGRSRLRRIHNPVDLAFVDRRAAASPMTFPGPGPHLVSVGNLHWRKGYDLLLPAFAGARRAWPDLTLTILGEGTERPRLEALARELELGEALNLHGHDPNPYPFVAAADLFVSASRYEGFANVILEALALGTPVVATDCPGANREVLFPPAGSRLAPLSADGLRAALLDALAHLDEVKGTVADLRARERFGAATIARRYEALFDEVLGRAPADDLGDLP